MKLIKIFLALMGALSLGSSSMAIAISCGQQNELEINVLLVPFTDPSDLNKLAKFLEPFVKEKLETKGFSNNVNITVGTDYSKVAQAITSGTAALADIPVVSYYEDSIKNNSNSMHQLFYASRAALRAEYNTADGENNSLEKINNVNKNGKMLDMVQDQKNVFNLVMASAEEKTADEIQSSITDNYPVSYHRAYQYISKVILKQYRDKRINDDSSENYLLKNAWSLITKAVNDQEAIFKVDDSETIALQDYWRVVWDIYEQSAAGLGIGLSTELTSGAGRINPIWTMIEAYILSHGKQLNNSSDLNEAKMAVKNLLDGHFVALKDYASTSLHDLMTEKGANRIAVGIGHADARLSYNSIDYTKQNIIDELTIFTSSHGINNNGFVYSTRFFKNKFNLLKAVQQSFVEISTENKDFRELYYKAAYQISYVPIDLEDSNAIIKYEQMLSEAQSNPFTDAAFEVSKTISPKK